jgi:hydroxymethylpyrimidine/phosphomethylpyrimidine kinase
LFADMPIGVIKLGLMSSIDVVEAVSELLSEHKDIPVVFDPVLAAGGGKNLSTDDLIDSFKTHLFPKVTLLTPNIPEAITLGIAEQDAEKQTILLKDQLCKNILITGTHSDSSKVHNNLYSKGELIAESSWRRLAHEYHGSGCTLASNIAGWLAQGFSLEYSVKKGQEFTWYSLDRGQRLGKGQHIPYRL